MSRLDVVNKDIKQLIENFFSLAVLKVFNLILPFVTLPYLIKTLGFEQYGAIVLALALMQYFQAVTDYGFNLSATRDIARHRHSKRQLSFIYSKVMASKLLLLVVSVSLILPVIFFVPQFQEDRVVFLLMLPVLIGHTLFPEWFFRGVEKMRYITVLDLSIKLFFTAGVFVFIHKPEDYWIYPLLNGIGYCVVAIVAHRLVNKHFYVSYISVGVKQVKETLKNGFPLLVNQFLPNLFNNTTNFAVGLILGKYSAGVFGAIRQVVQLLSVLNSVTTSVFFPFLSRNKNKFKIYSKIYLSMFFIFTLAFLILHKFVFRIMNIEHIDSSNILYILVLGALSIVIYSVYSTNYLIVRGHYNLVMKITAFSSLVGFLAFYPLISNYGMAGGALNILICQGLMGVLAFINYRKLRVND